MHAEDRRRPLESRRRHSGLAMGIHCVAGAVTNKAVAECFGLPYQPVPLA